MQCGVNSMKYTDQALLGKWVENEGGFVFGSVLILYVFSVFFFGCYPSLLVPGDNPSYIHFGTSTIFCNFTMFFCRWVNDETCLNVKSSRILEKGTFECGNVGFSVSLTELNIVNHHSNYYTKLIHIFYIIIQAKPAHAPLAFRVMGAFPIPVVCKL